MATASTLLAGAMAAGEDGLSPRDCWLCLGQIYSQGNSAQTQIKNAIANGLDRLAHEDVLRCIAFVLNPSTTPLNGPTLSQLATSPTWVWNSANPANWILEVSLDGSTNWAHVDTIDGSARTADDDITPGRYYRLYGIDAGGVTITGISNVLKGT